MAKAFQDILIPSVDIDLLKKQRNALLEEEPDYQLTRGLVGLLDAMLDIADGEMGNELRNAHQEALSRLQDTSTKNPYYTGQPTYANPFHEPVTESEKAAVEKLAPYPKPIREDILKKAQEIVTGEREDTYGGPEDSFNRIATFWDAFLLNKFGVEGLEPYDVALMMDLMKTARLMQAPDHSDSWIDKAGYAACGGEAALK